MSTPTSGGDVPIRPIDRFLAFMALGLAAAAIVCFFAIIIARPAGVTDFTEGIWPLIVLFPAIALPLAFAHDRGAADHELRAEGSGEPRGLMVSDERALATWLAARDDVGLARTLADRGVPPTVGWHDFFDAAEGLLDAASLDRALSRLPRRDLAALARGDAERSGGISPTSRCSGRTGGRSPPSPTGCEALTARPSRSAIAPTRRVDRSARSRTSAPRPRPRSGPSPPPARSPTCCSRACTRRSRAPARARSAPPTASASPKPAPSASPEELEDLIESAAGAGLTRRPRARVGRDGRRRALARVADGRALGDDRGGLPRGAARGPAHGQRAASPSAASWPRAYPLDPDWPARAAPTAPHRRALGAPRRRRRGAGVDRGAASRRARPIPLRSPRTSPPRSIASTCRPTSPRSLPVRSRRTSTCGCAASPPRVAGTGVDLPLHRRLARCRHDRGRDRAVDPRVPRRRSRSPASRSRSTTSSRAPPRGTVSCACASTPRPGAPASRAPSPACSTRSPSIRRCDRSDSCATTAPSTSRVARDAVYWSLADARYPVVALDAAGAPEPLHRRAATARVRRRRAIRAQAYARLIAAAARRAQHRGRGGVARPRARAGRARARRDPRRGADARRRGARADPRGDRARRRPPPRPRPGGRHRAHASGLEHRQRAASRPDPRTAVPHGMPGRIDPYG